MSFMAAAQRYFSSPKIRPQEASLPLIAELKQLSVVKILENGSQGQEERELEDVCSKALATLEDASQSLLAALHMVCKHLRFWQRKSQGLPRNQLRTMVLERGPWEFALSMTQFIKRAFSSSPDNRSLTEIASASVRERAALLTILRDRIASALGEVYTILDAFTVSTAEENWHEALLSALTSVHSALEQLEGSYDLPKITSGDIRSSIAALSIVLELRKHTAAAKDRERDTSALRRRIEQATELVADDISRVQDGVMILMAHYRRPSKAARLWVQYTAAGVGLAIVSSWLIRHSRLAGSDDLERWLHEGKHATVTFYQEHAVAPLKQIRDDLFETFRRRPSGIAEAEEVRLTAESLRRMLLEFAHVAKVDVEPTVSDQELMEILMTKYEKEVARPLQSLVGGELGRAMLIQVQKLKLDIET